MFDRRAVEHGNPAGCGPASFFASGEVGIDEYVESIRITDTISKIISVDQSGFANQISSDALKALLGIAIGH